MPKVSVNILTKNRSQLLSQALELLSRQTFKNFEIVLVNDGSTDDTLQVINKFSNINITTITHQQSLGIILSRQEALVSSKGEYIAIVDDDDKWSSVWNDEDKLKKQVEYLNNHPNCVLVGGGMRVVSYNEHKVIKRRPSSDFWIRQTMLFRNNFFTSTVMFRKDTAIKAGGFIKDDIDLAEDYDLWLRMGKLGGMHNFKQPFTQYAKPSYNKAKFQQFLTKQLQLISRHKSDYPYYWIASLILKFRISLGI